MLVASVTYLVILIQFELANKREPGDILVENIN